MDSILASEHPELLKCAVNLTAHVRLARERLAPVGDTWHHQHSQFGERLWSLSTHLEGALLLLHHDQYMPAFAVLRSALENYVQDHLLLLGNRYEAVVEGVSDETLAEWQEAISEEHEDFRGILEAKRIWRDRVQVVRSGPHYTGGERGLGAPGLSLYYHLVFDLYDPFTGGRNAQPFIGQWPHSRDAHQRWAAQAAENWGEFLVWRQLKANLLLNEFYTEQEIARFDVHYGFLSAFTHPTVKGMSAVAGRNQPVMLRYDHYASELILLYVIVLARLELEVFEQMSRREPVVNLSGWGQVRDEIERAKVVAAHLWFPRGSPDLYDRVQEANRRGQTPDGQLVPSDERPHPDQLAEGDVLYYANPLKRLIGLHTSQNEMTGFPYISPWPRSDGWTRSMD